MPDMLNARPSYGERKSLGDARRRSAEETRPLRGRLTAMWARKDAPRASRTVTLDLAGRARRLERAWRARLKTARSQPGHGRGREQKSTILNNLRAVAASRHATGTYTPASWDRTTCHLYNARYRPELACLSALSREPYFREPRHDCPAGLSHRRVKPKRRRARPACWPPRKCLQKQGTESLHGRIDTAGVCATTRLGEYVRPSADAGLREPLGNAMPFQTPLGITTTAEPRRNGRHFSTSKWAAAPGVPTIAGRFTRRPCGCTRTLPRPGAPRRLPPPFRTCPQ